MINLKKKLQSIFPVNIDNAINIKSNIAKKNLGTCRGAKFISFEGGEGSGKSTQSKMLYDYLTAQDIAVLLTREVGGTYEAEKIREILVHSHLLPMSEVMLVMAARFEHLNKVIIPALKSGKWVICDRFVDSTAVYQGYNSEIGINKIYEMHSNLISDIMPDMTFFLDLSVDEALLRTKGRTDNNKFEDKELEFHKSIYEGFQKISEEFNDRIIRIKVENHSKEEIFQKIINRL